MGKKSIIFSCTYLLSLHPIFRRVLKKRLKVEGNETVTNCNALKMRAADGKMRLTDIADTEFCLVGDNAASGGYFAGCK